ncbi:unnamed protein product [Chrysoparadoxa australica]
MEADATLNLRVIFESSTEAAVGANRSLSAAAITRGTRFFMCSGLGAPPVASANKLDLEALWHSSLLYWVHPPTRLPSNALSLQHDALLPLQQKLTLALAPPVPFGQKTAGAIAPESWTRFFWSRRRYWEEAFRSLFLALSDASRGSDSYGEPGFYMQSSQYTVAWRLTPEESIGCKRQRQLMAVMSRSSYQFRSRLEEAGVEYEMPLDPAAKSWSSADPEVLQELQAMGSRAGFSRGFFDKTKPHNSMLVFKGQSEVHGLFDVLLEGASLATGTGRMHDLPVLLSRAPFLNGSLRQLQVKSAGTVTHSTTSRTVSELELIGHVLPSAVPAMAEAMAHLCKLSIEEARAGGDRDERLGESKEGDHESGWLYSLSLTPDQDTTQLNQDKGHVVQIKAGSLPEGGDVEYDLKYIRKNG